MKLVPEVTNVERDCLSTWGDNALPASQYSCEYRTYNKEDLRLPPIPEHLIGLYSRDAMNYNLEGIIRFRDEFVFFRAFILRL